ncbi:MAG: hypothetical protein R3B53_00575 [Candidatus Paceibacterota bacterium]
MDTQTQTGSIAGIRTYAKDLERKKAENGAVDMSTAKKKVPVPIVTLKKPEERKYQAPSWTGNKKPVPPPPGKKEAIDEKLPDIPKSTSETSEPTLKPISAPKPNKESSIVIDNEDAASAVILSDTKKDRFKLVPSIFSSIADWFAEMKRKRAAKKIPKYTVPDATRRKGVIQRATSKTGKLTTFDHTSIQERIRARKERSTPREPLTIWTAKTEPGYPLLEAPEEVVSNVQVFPKKSFRSPATPVVEVPKPEPVIVKAPEPIPVIEKIPEPVVKVERPPVVVPPQPTVSTQEIKQPEPETLVEEVNLPVETEPEASEVVPVKRTVPTEVRPITNLNPKSFKEWLFIINTNVISLGVAGIVLALVVVGSGLYFWYSSQSGQLEIIVSPNYPAALTSPLQPVKLTATTKADLLNVVSENNNQSSFDVLQLILVDPLSTTGLIPASEVASILNPNLNAAFTQSLKYIYFGSVRKNDPFIILSITDPATAKGGMLAWELSLHDDLAGLFKNTGNLPATKFKDSVIENTDVRILENADGNNTLIVYGTANRGTIIITNKVETYKELIELIK